MISSGTARFSARRRRPAQVSVGAVVAESGGDDTDVNDDHGRDGSPRRSRVGGLPDGGLITTAADLRRLIDAFNAGELVGDATRDLMLTSYGKINDDAEDDGYGLEMYMSDRRPVILGHAGGHPGVSGIVSHYLDDATTIVVLCNSDRGSWPVSRMLAEAYGISDPRE